MALGITPQEIIDKSTHALLHIHEDWCRVNIEQIAHVQNGAPFSSEFFNHNDGLPLIRIRDIDRPTTENLYSGAFDDAFIVSYGDILIGMDGDFKASKWPGKKGLLNQRVCRLILLSQFYERGFLFLCLQPYLNAINEETSSVTVKHLSSRTINTIPLPLPPLPEQRAIVSKMEQLFSALDNGTANLKKAQAQLEVYRQAILNQLLNGGGATNNSSRKGTASTGWKERTIKDVCDVKVGIVIKPTNFYSKDGSGIKAFRSANVREFRIEDSNWVLFTKAGNELNERTKLKEGDVLIVRSGYPGTSCVVTKEFAGCNAIDVLIARPKKTDLIPKFLCAFNNSPLAKGLFNSGARGVAQKHLNVGVYNDLKILVPTIEEQHQIVQEIETRLSVCEKLEESIRESLQKSEALRQSILKRAFAGQLLTEEESALCRKEKDWEPAGVLLDRVKREKMKRLTAKSS